MADDAFTLQVAAGPHIFDPTRDIADAPRALTEVEGDFTAEVKILGDFQPGTVPIKGLFFTFQGAGLLLWHDKDNYVRFERAAGFDRERFQWLFLETCKDGKPSPKKPMNVRDAAVTLRAERHANLINYSYSLDGKTWLKVDNIATTLPRKISIGISATNASPRPFPARFTDFVLTPAS
jgi:regulation of enolase protein 1 (concanavalin A-like superfamily)